MIGGSNAGCGDGDSKIGIMLEDFQTYSPFKPQKLIADFSKAKIAGGEYESGIVIKASRGSGETYTKCKKTVFKTSSLGSYNLSIEKGLNQKEFNGALLYNKLFIDDSAIGAYCITLTRLQDTWISNKLINLHGDGRVTPIQTYDCPRLHVEHESKPIGWDDNWINATQTVIWGVSEKQFDKM